jgi:hypothetical protein
MVYEKEVAILAGASAAGVVQTLLIQKYIEPTQGNWVPQIGAFGKPGALLGIVSGVVAIAVGYLAMKRQITYVADPRLQFALLGYGGSALASGVVAGVLGGGMTATSRAFPRTAAVRAVPVGAGYSMVNRRDTNLL